MSNLFFTPWVGKNYLNSKEKILLIGESHYHGFEYTETFTNEIVEEFIEGSPYKFYVNAGSLFYDDARKIWNNIAFSNLIQKCFGNALEQPTTADKKNAGLAFSELLRTLQPDKVVVLSKRMWASWLPDNEGKKLSELKEGNRFSTVWEFPTGAGTCKCIGVCHPSRMFGRNGTPKEWSGLVKKFIEQN